MLPLASIELCGCSEFTWKALAHLGAPRSWALYVYFRKPLSSLPFSLTLSIFSLLPLPQSLFWFFRRGLPYSPPWPGTYSNSPASASQILRFQAWVITAGIFAFFLTKGGFLFVLKKWSWFSCFKPEEKMSSVFKVTFSGSQFIVHQIFPQKVQFSGFGHIHRIV